MGGMAIGGCLLFAQFLKFNLFSSRFPEALVFRMALGPPGLEDLQAVKAGEGNRFRMIVADGVGPGSRVLAQSA